MGCITAQTILGPLWMCDAPAWTLASPRTPGRLGRGHSPPGSWPRRPSSLSYSPKIISVEVPVASNFPLASAVSFASAVACFRPR
jgi:hypothetical protein